MDDPYDPFRGIYRRYEEEEEEVVEGIYEKEGLFGPDPSDPGYKATQRTSISGARMTEQEWQNMLRDPKKYSLYQLQYGVFKEEPFDDISSNSQNRIYLDLKDFPHLEIRNIQLLVAAYLFHKHEGNLDGVTKNSLEKSYQPYKPIFNKVDFIRYIRLIEKNEK